MLTRSPKRRQYVAIAIAGGIGLLISLVRALILRDIEHELAAFPEWQPRLRWWAFLLICWSLIGAGIAVALIRLRRANGNE